MSDGYVWKDDKFNFDEHRLVAPDGEIVARIKYTRGGSYRFGMKEYESLEQAKKAAERFVKP